MTSMSTWERIERQNLRRRERQMRHARPGERSDPGRPAGTDMLPQIKHILVVMMENHSFDNYLGTLGRGEGFPVDDDGTPDAENPDSAGAMIRAYHASSTVQKDGVPCQSWSASHTQWADGKMTGFVTSSHPQVPVPGDPIPGPDRQGQGTMGHQVEAGPERLRDHLRRPPRPSTTINRSRCQLHR